MKKILKPSSPVFDNNPDMERPFQEISLEKLIEERIEGMRNYMGGLSEIRGFNLYNIIISEVERALISSVLKETKGNQLKASKILGINRNTLRKKIRDLKI